VIALDTNVLSELMRAEPAAAVFTSAQPRAALYTTSVSKAEILYGIAVLPEDRRRLALAVAAGRRPTSRRSRIPWCACRTSPCTSKDTWRSWDINPLMVLPSGRGVRAVDALVVFRGT
jgi:predicted nucleic acid-binding protein